MRAVADTDPFPGDEALGRVIAAKLRRQALLYEPGREFVHVVTEAALRLRIGSATVEVQRGQLAHLAELATLPQHTFAVLPFDRPCPVFPTGFAVYDRDLVRVETSAGVLELTDPPAVARYAQRLDRLVEVSLVGAEAADLCRAIAAG